MNIAEEMDKNGMLEFALGSLISADANLISEKIKLNITALKNIKKAIEESNLEESRKQKLISVCDVGLKITGRDLKDAIE